MTRPASLQAALDDAYAAFAHVQRPERLEASPTHDRARILALTAAPLNKLTDEAIGTYAGSALWTIGGSRDYAYFLPRILELAVDNGAWIGTEPAVVGKKVQMAEWRRWRDAQQAAVVRVFETAFHSALETAPDGDVQAGPWLCGLVSLGLDVEPYLAGWGQKTSLQAAFQLAHFITETLEADGSVSGGWWDEQPGAARSAVGRWLLMEDRKAPLVEAAGRFGADADWDLELALMKLETTASALAAARTGGGAAGED